MLAEVKERMKANREMWSVYIKKKRTQRDVTCSTTLGYATATAYAFNEKCITLGVSWCPCVCGVLGLCVQSL